ncbi:hypothetical protein [Alkalitalea saponilacus]|uniref:Uncharacterized protein n=1 Tax=Alkalitalea saponilacus TaxID=889453 RepID=A0A1T5HMW4_9BACT|nr:hypothetical protein [Alkalitalea saponilacus]ASB49373.1 hypothetical protein CDL62_09590 [Alkalitalea saponilacus]SKC22023.1 hypothetical protein SAMN03080601_02490 [Alkalitalea saponilacus]
MIYIPNFKKLQFVFLPAILVLLSGMLFSWLNPVISTGDFREFQIIHKYPFLRHIETFFFLFLLFVWEFIYDKKFREIFYLSGVVAGVLLFRFLISQIPIEIEIYLNPLINNFGLLLIARSFLLGYKSNYLIKYLLGIGMFYLMTNTGINMDLVVSVFYRFQGFWLAQLINLFVYILCFSFLFYYLFFFDNSGFIELFKANRSTFKTKLLSQKEFLVGFCFNYSFLVFVVWGFNRVVGRFDDYLEYEMPLFYPLYMMLFLLSGVVLSGLQTVTISKKWLHQHKRITSWYYLFLMIPVINIFLLYFITNTKKNEDHQIRMENSKRYRESYLRDERDNVRNFLIVMRLIGVVVSVFAFVRLFPYSQDRAMLLFLILFSFIEFVLFIVYSRQRKAIFFLIANAVIVAFMSYFLNFLTVGEMIQSLVFGIFGLLLIFDALHPQTPFFEEIVTGQKE